LETAEKKELNLQVECTYTRDHYREGDKSESDEKHDEREKKSIDNESEVEARIMLSLSNNVIFFSLISLFSVPAAQLGMESECEEEKNEQNLRFLTSERDAS
jgi:hypothetical protein